MRACCKRSMILWPVLLNALLCGTVLPADEQYDVVIANGRVIDPETLFDAVRNVGISNGMIVRITQEPLAGKETIDAKGHVVTAGFIDANFHGLDPLSVKLAMRDGVTTGMDLVYGAWPVGRWYDEKDRNWPINYGTTVSQELVRMSVHDAKDGIDFSDPIDASTAIMTAREKAANDGVQGWAIANSDRTQLNEITRRLDDGLREGALGLGSTLGAMRHGVSTYEMFEAQRAAARYGRLTAVQSRFHANANPPTESSLGFAEVISNAMLLKAPLMIAHDNSNGWWEIEEKLRLARGMGLDMWGVYTPYEAGLYPIGSEFLRPELWEDRLGNAYKDTVYDPNVGKFLAKTDFLKLLEDDPEREVAVFSPLGKLWLPMWLKTPHMLVSSDGMPGVDSTGQPLKKDATPEQYVGHPRTAGTHARVLRLGREHNVPIMFTLSQLSYWQAKHLGDAGIEAMRIRGRMQEGMAADIVVFDPDNVTDNATFKTGENGRPSSGIPYVLVDGKFVVKGNEVQKNMAGRPIRYAAELRGRFKPAAKPDWPPGIAINPNPLAARNRGTNLPSVISLNPKASTGSPNTEQGEQAKASPARPHRSLGLFPYDKNCPCCDNANPLRAKLLKEMRKASQPKTPEN